MRKGSPTIDIIIPAYKPGRKFSCLLSMLEKQTYPIRKIIVMNTEEQYWTKTSYESVPNLEVHHISKSEFDHGETRNRGISYSEADLFLCMTDDAVPADNRLVEQLVEGFSRRGLKGERPAMVYARQLPDKECGQIERCTRSFNYPGESRVKSKSDLPSLGIKTYFASNVCCAYDRKIYEKLGGFTQPAIFNEDMIFAAGAIQAGYSVVYQAGARVIHSHNYSGIQQFRRNFDLAVSQADHPEVFAGLPSEGEGIRLVKRTAAVLASQGRPWLIFNLVLYSGWKYMGYLVGRHYNVLPRSIRLRCTMNRSYWEKTGDKQ